MEELLHAKIDQLQEELYAARQKSGRRKKCLRTLNKQMNMYVAVADAAISDAARWQAMSDMWKERYMNLKFKEEE